jgi:hypothetical protein
VHEPIVASGRAFHSAFDHADHAPRSHRHGRPTPDTPKSAGQVGVLECHLGIERKRDRDRLADHLLVPNRSLAAGEAPGGQDRQSA